MQTETFNIVTTKEKFFQQYLTLKRPIIDAMLSSINRKKTVLSDAPMSVLAQLLYYNDLYNDEPSDDKRWDKVFSRETKLLIMKALSMKEHHLNNYLTLLRKLKILDGKKIREPFLIYAIDDRILNFTFKLNGHK